MRKADGTWSYDSVADFIENLEGYKTFSVNIFFENDISLDMGFYSDCRLELGVSALTKQPILDFEVEADSIFSSDPGEPDEWEAQLPTVFIGHGRSEDWRILKDHLQDQHNNKVEAFEVGSRAGHTIRGVLSNMISVSTLAIIVHTPEDEQADGSMNSRPNVIHETGLFQGALGFDKAVVLMKEGVNEFSNLSGIVQFRYQSIDQKFGDILAWISRES